MGGSVAEDCAGVKPVHNRLRVQKHDGLSGAAGGSSSSRAGGTSEATSGSEKGSRPQSGV